MKHLTALLFITTSALYAETESQFRDRVAQAWTSKEPAAILKLYGDGERLEPGLKKSLTSMIDFQLKKDFSSAEVTLMPAGKEPRKPIFMNGQMGYAELEFAGQASIKLGSSGSLTSPYIKNAKGDYSFAVPQTKKIEWSGGDMANFNVNIRSEQAGAYLPTAVVVLERYGRVDFELVDSNLSFRAHGIQSIVIPSTPDSGFIVVEVGQGADNIVFTSNIDASKGAVVQVDLKAP